MRIASSNYGRAYLPISDRPPCSKYESAVHGCASAEVKSRGIRIKEERERERERERENWALARAPRDIVGRDRGNYDNHAPPIPLVDADHPEIGGSRLAARKGRGCVRSRSCFGGTETLTCRRQSGGLSQGRSSTKTDVASRIRTLTSGACY